MLRVAAIRYYSGSRQGSNPGTAPFVPMERNSNMSVTNQAHQVCHIGDGKHAVIVIDGVTHDLNNADGEHFTTCAHCTAELMNELTKELTNSEEAE